jgi:HEAT repeat protein
MSGGVGFENTPFGHSEQNWLGPFGILLVTPLAGRATTYLARVHKLDSPGFEEQVYLTLIRIHVGKLPHSGGGVEPHELPPAPVHEVYQNLCRFSPGLENERFERDSGSAVAFAAFHQVSFFIDIRYSEQTSYSFTHELSRHELAQKSLHWLQIMLWWTFQQLRVSSSKTRLATVEKLAQSEHSDSVEPLLFALKDREVDVRSAAARGLGRFQDRRAVEPLVQMLRDRAPLARAAAAEALGRLGDARAVGWLVRLLRDAEPAVRSRASLSLRQLGWQPENDTERAFHLMATGTLRQVAALGADAIEPLVELLRKGPPDKQLEAVKALGEMDDRKAVKPLLEALQKNLPAVRIAALEALERFADPSAYDGLAQLLADPNPSIRSAAAEAAAKCNGTRAVSGLIHLLGDSSWEVRQAAVRALGNLGESAAVEALCRALHDKDRDVREGATAALGRIGDARAIYPLVLALLDSESTVRNAATNSLQRIDHDWLNTEAARKAWPEIKTAQNHRDYWVRHSATKLLQQLNGVAPEKAARRPPRVPAAQLSEKPTHPAFAILEDLLCDRDRDLRLAAVMAFRQLREKGAQAILATATRDGDALVQQAARNALAALN